MTVIADYVTVSTPIGAGLDLRDALTDVCLRLPESQTDPLGVRLGKFGLLRCVDQTRNQISVASCSGMMLAALRAANLLTEYVAAVASVTTYNVTHLDLARDQLGDPPSVVQTYYQRLRIAGVKLSRKTVPPGRIKSLFSKGDDGRDTGSVMIQNRQTSRVSAIIYDRQADALAKGKPDPGPITRIEMRLGVPGMTLRDVLDPAPLFYEYASPGLLPRDPSVRQWEPFSDGGFRVARLERTAYERLARTVDQSTDLAAMFRQAALLDGDGVDVLLRLVRQRHRIWLNTESFGAVGTASRATADNSGAVE